MEHVCRADLHVHSRYSDAPSSRLLRGIGCPESFTSPRTVYETARRRGMDLVTITDHNSIVGALQIANLPGVFLSAELSTRFPETGCRLHVVALGVSERQFPDLMAARPSVYELAALLRAEDIVHYIAHPLYDFDGTLDADAVEKLLLLFDVFETRNGARAGQYNEALVRLLQRLSPETIERLADKHGLEPHGPTPWLKGMVGGSDDHSGFFIARAYTVAEGCAGPTDLLAAVRGHRTTAGGEHGDPLTLAHNLWGIGYRWGEERLGFDRRNGYLAFFNTLLDGLLPETSGDPSELERARLAGELSFADVAAILQAQIAAGTLHLGPKPPPEQAASGDGEAGAASRAARRAAGTTRLFYSGRFRDFARDFAREMDSEAQLLLGDQSFREQSQDLAANHRVFAATSRLADRLMYRFASRAVADVGEAHRAHQTEHRIPTPRAAGRRLREGAGHLGAAGFVLFLALPYYYGFHSQNKSKELLDELTRRFPEVSGGLPDRTGGRRAKAALFLDALDGGEVAVVERTRRLAAAAGVELVVVTAELDALPPGMRGDDVKSFAALGPIKLPGIHDLTLAFPPVLEAVDFLDREGVTVMHAVTPGPLGWLARTAARLLGLPFTVEYSAALPNAARRVTGSRLREEWTWRYLARFCRTADEIVIGGTLDATAGGGTDDGLIGGAAGETLGRASDALVERLARTRLPLEKVRVLPSWLELGGEATAPPATRGAVPTTPGSRSTPH
jgi:hypothetical protein